MVCRENPASSVVIALARNGTWLDDAQVQSIFHRLRHDPLSGSSPLRPDLRDAMVDQVFRRATRQIDQDPVLRPQRRQGLRTRLENSRARTDGLGDDTLSAMNRLEIGVRASQRATEGRLHELAGQLGMSPREVRAEFVRLRSEAPSGRQARATPEELNDLGVIPSDAATRHALTSLRERSPLRPPVRLVQRWMRIRADPDAESAGLISEIGYSDLSNRVELRGHDGTITAWTVPPEMRQEFDESCVVSRPTTATVDQISYLAPRTEIRVEETAWAVRCDHCGQFIGDRAHHCPITATSTMAAPTQAWIPGAGGALQTASAEEIRQAVDSNNEPMIVELTYDQPDQAAVVSGAVTVRPGGDAITDADRRGRQILDIDDSEPGELTCSTCTASCAHITQARQQFRQYLAALGAIPSPQQQQTAARTALTQLSDRTPVRGTQLPPQSGQRSFVDDPEAFRAVIRDAGTERIVPFRTEGVFGPDLAGTRFGVELEFNANLASARGDVARQLAQAGIIRNSSMGYYHQMAEDGDYEGDYWELEQDCTVAAGGELITTICSDNQQDWARLDRACQIIRDNGGTTDNAGSHTNVSAPGFTQEHAYRLVQMFRTFEDDLLRCGRTPGAQRDRRWTRTFADPGPSWEAMNHYEVMHRYRVVNFDHAFNGEDSRLEFRFPDASHIPGVIQGQVQLAAGLARYVRDHDVPGGINPRRLGSARAEGWTNRLMSSSEGEWADRTHHIRTLVDVLFSRDVDRQQMALLWAHGRYKCS